MSQPAFKRHPFDDATEAELARWPGVTARREVRSKHLALILTFQGKSRMVIYAATPGDTNRGAQNHIRTIRKELRDLGAVRERQARSAAPPKRPSQQRHLPPLRIGSAPATGEGPSRDPWAALNDLNLPERAPPEPPSTPKWTLLTWIAGHIRSLFRRP